MKRKDYQKPTMKVEELQDCCDILRGSPQGGQGSLRNYNWHGENEGTGVQNYLWNNETEE